MEVIAFVVALSAAVTKIVERIKTAVPALTGTRTTAVAIALGVGAAYLLDVQVVDALVAELGDGRDIDPIVDNVVTGVIIGTGGGVIADLLEGVTASRESIQVDHV